VVKKNVSNKIVKFTLTKNTNPKIVANYLVHNKLQRNRLKPHFVATYIQLAKLPVIKQNSTAREHAKPAVSKDNANAIKSQQLYKRKENRMKIK